MNTSSTKKAGASRPVEIRGDNTIVTAWDRFAIKAEVERRGANLTELAIAAGLERSSLRVAMNRPFPAADRVLADFLGVSLCQLWPDRYDAAGNRLTERHQHLSKGRDAPSRRNRNAA